MTAAVPGSDATSTTRSTVTVGDVDLAIAEAGRGGRPLLLVHGFTGAKEDFGDWMDALAADGWWVVAPDLRGHGTSSKPESEAHYSLATLAADLVGLVDTLGWERFALLGHSMGGAVAQEVALGAPERIDRLVLMDTHHGAFEFVAPELAAVGAELIRTDGLPALLALLEAFPGEKAPADERVRASRPGYVEWNQSKLDVVAPAMYAALGYELVTRPDRLGELATFSVPTLVIVGEQDGHLVDAAQRMADALPTATHVVVPDAAHSPQFENPEAWWAAIQAFLTSDAVVD